MLENNTPPRWAIRFFEWFCNDHLSEAVLGDLLHLYDRRINTVGKWKADILFVWNVVQFIQPFALRKKNMSNLNNLTMYKNYFKVALRNMSAQKMYTAIKIGGFALGLATCIVIALFIRHELSYDNHYKNVNDIYRVYNEQTAPEAGKWTAFPAPFVPLLKSSFPEVELAARLIPYSWFNAGTNLVRKDDQVENTYEEGFAYADPELLEILEIPMVYGNRSSALSQPSTIVISKKKADKYFPGEDPTGKIIVLNDDKKISLTIGGVMEDFKPTSHLQFDFFITLSGKEFWQGEQTSWCCWNYNPYIKLRAGTDPVEFEKKMLSLKKVYIEYLIKEKNQSVDDVRKYYGFRLQPVKDVHLYSDGIGDIIPHGDIRYIWMFGGIAIFILALACINFVNLSTAKSANRAKEVGLRKVVGSHRSSLVNQFLSESILYSIVSFLLALGILSIGLPYFNQLAGKVIDVPWKEWWFLPGVIGASIIVGLVAGLYPSFYLSAFKPIDVLKGSVARGMKNSRLRSVMVVFQFTTSIVLIIGTFVIYQQMNYILTKKIGYDKEQVIMVQGVNTLGDQQRTFKDELLRLASVQNVTLTQYFPVAGTKRDMNQFWRDGKSQEEKSNGAQVWYVDEDYINTMGMKLVAGRNFQKDLASDSSAIIINQSMVKVFGFKQPLGERIMNWRTWTVIGVVEDFHFENMKDKIEPLCFVRGGWGNIAAIKLKTHKMEDAIQSITEVWKKFLPHQTIRYTFLDESYARMYDDVRRTGNIFASFAILAIIVACLGLFALSAFMVEQRNKEISIRLVLGASLQNIFRLLTDQFIKLVLISFLLSIPLAWYVMQRWLEDYEYKIEIGWQVFVVAGIVSVLIALLTVSYQSIRAALANPANNLRSE
ncbi:ABC transporter permease [Chryseolinea sp. H1M3-3]|uniref:ABC transporter permease n=1 Tax=Chryseolinea sp. H1M3-3 TaxID=3034144 RepID=UPI0023EAAE8D|nr:ABC transporter permease [Chryseolinea sp. H1M3-3]